MLARSASLARAEPAIPTHEQQLRSGWDCRALGGARSRIGCRYCLVSVLDHERGSSACLLASGGDGRALGGASSRIGWRYRLVSWLTNAALRPACSRLVAMAESSRCVPGKDQTPGPACGDPLPGRPAEGSPAVRVNDYAADCWRT